MKRFVLLGSVAVVIVAAVAIVATLLAGLATCWGEGDPYAVGSPAEKFCYSNSGLATAFFIAEVVVPVMCMIAFTMWAAARQRLALLGAGAATSFAIIVGMAAVPPNLSTDCSQGQAEGGDNCG